MKLFHSFDNLDLAHGAVVTVGNFDGVHLGHREIFSAMKRIASSAGVQSVVLSFAAHPRKVLYPELRLPVILTAAERIDAVAQCGIDAMILMDFTRETAAMHAGEFVEKYIADILHASSVVIGYDHAFGRNREGNIDYLNAIGQRCGFGVMQVPPFVLDGHPVSSTRIRAELEDGDVKDAARYLGRRYALEGAVCEGRRIGRTIGFPTANLYPGDADKIIPADGVYAVIVRMPDASMRRGMTSIGTNPTFGDMPRSIETHIFDFSGDLYNKRITLEFTERIRSQLAFPSMEALKEAICGDEAAARLILG